MLRNFLGMLSTSKHPSSYGLGHIPIRLLLTLMSTEPLNQRHNKVKDVNFTTYLFHITYVHVVHRHLYYRSRFLYLECLAVPPFLNKFLEAECQKSNETNVLMSAKKRSELYDLSVISVNYQNHCANREY